LIRRLYLDLIGLLPTPEETDAFVNDSSPDAYERLVERLLASPNYGERWGRQWLDLARYADSNGYTRDMPRDIWKYREWVIDALNRNLPFDQFVIEQLAGDMLPDADMRQLVATGFHRNTLFNEEGGIDPEQFRVERTVDRTNTTASVFLGLTVGCAQCHDHKFDPISQREYYQLFAFFNNADEPSVDVPSAMEIAAGQPQRRQQLLDEIAKFEAQFRSESWEPFEKEEIEWEKQLTEDDKKKLPFQVLNAVNLSRGDRNETHLKALYEYYQALPAVRQQFPLLEQVNQLRQQLPVFASTMIMRERSEPRESFVQIRGDFLRPAARVFPQVLDVLPPLVPRGSQADRLDLARWLVDKSNPLTPRVAVNRLWQRYFGRGLVETENDFGTQGTRPTHPDLLDWLASEFVDRGWDQKRLHWLIVTSATYRQSSRHRSDVEAQDPQNVWLARQNRMRVDAELLRDEALAASGMLTNTLGGPSVYPPQPDGVFDFTQDRKPWPTAAGADRFRRAMYTYLWRSSPHPALSVFDFPDANVTCTRRVRSNTPLQSLNLANDEVFVELARALAVRTLTLPRNDDAERVRYAFRRCLVRTPSDAEVSRLLEFVNQERAAFDVDVPAACVLAGLEDNSQQNAPERAAWVSLARVLMNVDEFVTRE
jgi:hypothetical protein